MNGIFWLASYPKSGNTWLRALLTNYLRNSTEPADINDLDITVAGFMRESFDEWLGIDSVDLTPKQIEHYRPLVYDAMAANAVESLFLKVHDAYQFNADSKPLFSKPATAGVIYLIRNPLDVAVSFANHRNKTINNTIRLMNDTEAFLIKDDGTQLPQKLSSWNSHATSWIDEPYLNIRVFRYEDMLADTVKVFSEIVRFAKLDFDAERVEKAVAFSSFKQLQEQEKIQGFKEKQPTAPSFFRSGKSGSWRESLSEEQVRRIVSEHQNVMRRFGYLNETGEISV